MNTQPLADALKTVNPYLQSACTYLQNETNKETLELATKVALVVPSIFLATQAFFAFALSFAAGAALRKVDLLGETGETTKKLFNDIMTQLHEKNLDLAGFAILSVLAPTVSLIALTAVHGYNLTDTFFPSTDEDLHEKTEGVAVN